MQTNTLARAHSKSHLAGLANQKLDVEDGLPRRVRRPGEFSHSAQQHFCLRKFCLRGTSSCGGTRNG